MIDTTLENWMEVQVTPEIEDLYTKIIGLLDSVMDEGSQSGIQLRMIDCIYSFIGDEEDTVPKPDNIIADEIREMLYHDLLNTIEQFGVVVNENSTIQKAYELLDGLVSIDGSEDIGRILAAAGSDDDSVGRLSEILHIVTTVEACHWEDLIESVSDDLIKKINELGTTAVIDHYAANEETAMYLQNIRIYAQYIRQKGKDLRIFELAADTQLGMAMDVYMNSGIVNQVLDSPEVEQLAQEMYGMAIISSDGRTDPTNFIRGVIDKYISDVSQIVKLNGAVGRLNGDYMKFYQESKALMKDNDE